MDECVCVLGGQLHPAVVAFPMNSNGIAASQYNIEAASFANEIFHATQLRWKKEHSKQITKCL